MKPRAQLIDEGKVWQVCQGETLLFEGTKTECKTYMAENGLNTLHRRGDVSFGKVILELNLPAYYVKSKHGGISLEEHKDGTLQRHIYFESFSQRTKFLKSKQS